MRNDSKRLRTFSIKSKIERRWRSISKRSLDEEIKRNENEELSLKKKRRRMGSVLMKNMWRCEIEKNDEFELLSLMKKLKRSSIECMIMRDLDIE